MLRSILAAFLMIGLGTLLAGCQLFGKHDAAATQASAEVANAVEHNAAAVNPPKAAPVPVAKGPDYPATATLIGYGKFETLAGGCPGAGVMYVVDDASGKVIWAMYVPEGTGSASRFADGPAELKSMFDKDKYYRIYFQSMPRSTAPQPAVK